MPRSGGWWRAPGSIRRPLRRGWRSPAGGRGPPGGWRPRAGAGGGGGWARPAGDVVAEELMGDAARGGPGFDWSGTLRRLAVVGAADRDLLGVGEADFDALARADIVVRTEFGLAVREPFRSVL